MMHPRFLIGLAALLLLGAPPARAAEEQETESTLPFPIEACLGDAQDAMGQRQRELRIVLLGQPEAKRSLPGSLRYDKEGKPWLKTAKDTWKSAPAEEEKDENAAPSPSQPNEDEETKSDSDMDDNGEFPPRLGWLEVKKAQTSELLPPILQSVRAFQCKLDNVCLLLSRSIIEDQPDEIEVSSPGCIKETLPPLSACAITGADAPDSTAVIRVIEQCEQMRDTIAAREAQMLKLLIAYDSAQRSLRQLLGMMDTFVADLRNVLLGPVWQAVRAYQNIGRLPCFSSQCEQ